MPYIRSDTYTEYSVFRGCDEEIYIFVYTEDSTLTLKGKLELNVMRMTYGYFVLSESRISFEFHFVIDP
jgi:hypothetical protein